MARKKVGKNVAHDFSVHGKSFDELLEVNANKLTASNLRAITSRLVSVANKRLNRLQKPSKELNGQSYLDYSSSKDEILDIIKRGKFSTLKIENGKRARKNRNELLSEFTDLKIFLQSKTGSVEGIKKIRKDVEKRLNDEIKISKGKEYEAKKDKIKLSLEDFAKTMNLWQRIKREGGGAINKIDGGSSRIQSIIASTIVQKSYDDAIEEVTKIIESEYQQATPSASEESPFVILGGNDELSNNKQDL